MKMIRYTHTKKKMLKIFFFPCFRTFSCSTVLNTKIKRDNSLEIQDNVESSKQQISPEEKNLYNNDESWGCIFIWFRWNY